MIELDARHLLVELVFLGLVVETVERLTIDLDGHILQIIHGIRRLFRLIIVTTRRRLRLGRFTGVLELVGDLNAAIRAGDGDAAGSLRVGARIGGVMIPTLRNAGQLDVCHIRIDRVCGVLVVETV